VEVVGRGVRELTIETWDTVLLSISLITAMLFYNAPLTALALIPVPAAMLLAHATGRWVKGRTTAAREANSALTAELQERLTGVRVLRLFGRASAAVERIRALADRQALANLAVVRLQAGLAPVYNTMMMAGVVLVVWLGGRDVIAGAMTVGSFVAYLELYLRFVNRGARVPRLLNSVQSAVAAYARLEPLLIPPLPASVCPRWSSFRPNFIAGEDDVQVRTIPRLTGPVSLELRDAIFRYPGASGAALKGVSLDVPSGAFVAVTGPVGSGKSAVARAVLGLYPLESGRVLWDGVPLGEIPPADRAARSGYLPQEAALFSGSIRENILMGLPEGGPDGAEMVRRSVECAALAGDVEGFPDGLETQIGETGVRISGGQRQRVALARALAASLPGFPGLLVLDDPFSAVDVETEIRIIRGLRERHGARAPAGSRASILLLSHRLAAFPLADLVVVLSGGLVEESGTHEKLLRAGGLYARIFRAQGKARRAGGESA
jgi:ABC-type multidrug transport system fused ATPase/permease subunit